MIRRLLQRLFGPSGDVYVVVDWHRMRIIGVSVRQQGAELIRANYVSSHATQDRSRTIIENHELQDTE